MTPFKQDLIDKISSFNYLKFYNWIKAILQGCDIPPNFRQSKPGKFLFDLFFYIAEEKFRENFLGIISDLIKPLEKLSRKQAEESKVYISELLYLCGKLKQLEKESTLLEIAVSGKFKGIETDDSELHVDLLKVLASHKIVGNSGFWINQLMDESNRYYAFPAFWALRDEPDILFEYMAIFIDRFDGEPELEAAICLLIGKYGKEEIVKRFNVIASNLSIQQKQAANEAFTANGYDAVYQLEKMEPVDKGLQYKLLFPRLQYIRESYPEYKTTSLRLKAGEIFRLMGYKVEFNRCFANGAVDIFLKKKEELSNDYECWICFINDEKRKVDKKEISRLYSIREAARKELENESGDCQAMVISESEKGFTKKAVETAQMHKIELTSINQLTSDLKFFREKYKKLIQNLQSLTWTESLKKGNF
jgi:hypothetical protein